MRRIVILAVLAVFCMGAAVVLADEGQTAPVKGKNCKEILPFQLIADTMKPGTVKPKNKLRDLDIGPSQRATNFQSFYDEIKTGAEQAKKSSLRNTTAK